MERAIAEMEKIKKAEEIYSKRKNLEDEEKKPRNIYKFLFEVLILINITIVVVAVQNQKYIFTEEFISKINSYNINIRNKIETTFTNSNQEQTQDSKEEKKDTGETDGISGEVNSANSAILVENQLENEVQENLEQQPEIVQELSQEDKDIIEIKENYSVILPLNGIKTSGFGERESTNSKVTKNHTGVDIASNLGTVIVASTSGKVTQVSSSGDYGNHFRVQIWDLEVLYAHCSKIYVKEGQEINQGDQIAEVGSTGNSTGPHLHFELKLHNRLVNPEKIISI